MSYSDSDVAVDIRTTLDHFSGFQKPGATSQEASCQHVQHILQLQLFITFGWGSCYQTHRQQFSTISSINQNLYSTSLSNSIARKNRILGRFPLMLIFTKLLLATHIFRLL